MTYRWLAFFWAWGMIAAFGGVASAQFDAPAEKALEALEQALGNTGQADVPSRDKAGEPVTIEVGKAGHGLYFNAKYRYRIAYPEAVFTPQGESDAGDGQRFLAAGGRAQLVVYAAFNVLGTTLDGQFREALAQTGRTVTYQILRKDWFVVSGLAGNDIFYRKTFLVNDTFYTFELTYPKSLKATFDPLIAGILQSFASY